MEGASRPRGRPAGSKDKKPRASRSAPKGGADTTSSGPTPSSSKVPSKAPSATPPSLPRDSLPPAVLATLEKPSVSNFARTHAIFTSSEKVSKKKFLGEVKEFARAKGISEEFVESCVGEAKDLLKKRKEAKATEASEPVVKQEEPEEPAQVQTAETREKKKKKKKKDEPSESAATQETVVKQEEPEEPATEPKKSKRKKDKTSDNVSTQPEPATQADDDKTSKKRKKKDKARESAVDPPPAETPTASKSEEPPTEPKKSKEKKSKTPKHACTAPEQRPTETPIPLPTMTRTEPAKDPGDGAPKSKSSKKRKRDASDDGASKPESGEAEIPDAPASSKKKKHSKSAHEPEPKPSEGQQAKKEKKHKSQPAARSPSPPPRKKTKREHKDGETTHLASTAQDSSHKSHEHADKGKGKKDQKAKSEKTHHASADPQPGSSKTTAPEREAGQEREEQPTAHAQSDALTPRESKKKRKKEKKEKRQSEALQTQPPQRNDESELESRSRQPEAEPEAEPEADPEAEPEVQSAKKKKKSKKRKSVAAPEASAGLPIGVQVPPAKPSSKPIQQTADTGSAKPSLSKRKRSPSPPSSPPHKETPQDDARRLSLASSSSVFSLPTLTRFAKDTLVLPEPPQGMEARARKRWRRKMRRSLLQALDESQEETSSNVANSGPQKPDAGADMVATPDGESRSSKPAKKKAKVEQKANEPSSENATVSEVPIVSDKGRDSTPEQAAAPEPAVKRPPVTATGSFAHDTPVPPISSPERPTSANQAPAVPDAPDSPPKPDLDGWDALPAQYVSESEPEPDAHDATDLEPDTPAQPLQPPHQAGDEDADSESTESESDTESESESESEAEAPPPKKLPMPTLKTASQVATPSQRSFADTFGQPANSRPHPLLSMSQLKASTPTLSQSRSGVPLKPKTPPKANGNVDILGIAHGSDESDDESSGSSSNSDDGDDERPKQAKASDSKPATAHGSSSQPSKLLAESMSNIPREPVQTGRESSAAPGSSVSQAGPKTDTANVTGADENETASESSDDGSGDEEAAKADRKKLASPPTQTQTSQVDGAVEKSPEQRLPNSDGGEDVSRKGDAHESDEEDDSTASESDDESDSDPAKDHEAVSSPAHSPQQDKSEPPRSSPQAFKSPAKMPLRPLPKTDQSPSANNTDTRKSSEPAGKEDRGLGQTNTSGSADTTVNHPTEEASAEVAGEDAESPDTRDAARSERAPSTPGKRSPIPHREQVILQTSQASKSHSANDIINGVALTGSRAASPIADDEPQTEGPSTSDPEAQEPPANHSPAIDDIHAESLSGAGRESLLLPENSNQEHDVSSDGEADEPLFDPSSRPLSSPPKRARSPPAADAIEDEGLDMGQNESLLERGGGHIKEEDVSSTRASPAAREVTTTHLDAPPSQSRLSGQGRKTLPKPSRDQPQERRSLRVRSSNRLEPGVAPVTVKREDAAKLEDEVQASSSTVKELTIIDLDEIPSQLRLPNGRFASSSAKKAKPTPNRVRAQAQDRRASGQFSKSNGQTPPSKQKRDRTLEPRFSRRKLLRELSVDPDTVNDENAAEQQDEGSPRLTRRNSKPSLGTQDQAEAPQTLTRSARLRGKTRVLYYEDIISVESDKDESDESVTETAARKQSSARKKTSQSSPRNPSGPSPPAQSPSPRPNKVAQSSTPPIRSTFFGVVIPSSQSQGGVSNPSRDSRDGKSAKKQHEDVVASTADAYQTNDVDPREPGTPPSPLGGAQEDEASAVDDENADEETWQEVDSAGGLSVHLEDKDDGSVVLGHESPPRAVLTASFSGTQDAAEEDSGSDKEEEAGEVEPDATREESPVSEMADSPSNNVTDFDGGESRAIQETPAPEEQRPVSETHDHAPRASRNAARQKSPSPDERDSDVEGGKPESPVKNPVETQDQAQKPVDEEAISDIEDQVSEAASRGSAYSFDEDPKGFLNEDGTISGQATPRRRTGLQSNHFTPNGSRPALSCLPFPPTTAEKFGLIQEELADEPLNLLIACMLLNKTKGIGAIPKFWELMERYPTVDELVAANFVDLVEMLRPLGLQNRKSESLILLCKNWTGNPPKKGTRYRMMDYPFKGAHKDIPTGITLADDDPRVSAFEVCHLPYVGDYSLDSWRIFCRDKLRGLADGYNGEGAEPGFEPEWKRVVPKDKELRAFLRWMWLREGWLWDPETGNKKRASEDKATASELERMRWDQEAGEEVRVSESDEDDAEEADGVAGGDLQGSPAKSFSSDGPSSQLVREQRNRTSQSQSQQSLARPRQQQERHLSLSQPQPSIAAHTQRASKTNAAISSAAPATLPTRLRSFARTTTTTTTSTSSSPVSAYRPRPMPLDLLGDDEDSDLNLAGFFRTPRAYRPRSSSAKWAKRGLVEETPPGSPRDAKQPTQHDNETDRVEGREQESDMENSSFIGDEGQDVRKGHDGHREGGDDDEHDDDKATASGAVADAGHRAPSSAPQQEGKEESGPEPQLSVDEQAEGGTASQESNKSCCVM